MLENIKQTLDTAKEVVKKVSLETNSIAKEIVELKEIKLDDIKLKNPDLHKLVNDVCNRLGQSDFKENITCTLESDDKFTIQNTAYPDSSFQVYGKDVFAKSGGGALNEFINNSELMPNHTYHIDNRSIFKSDALGRIEEVKQNYSLPFDAKSDSQIKEAPTKGNPSNLAAPLEAINKTPIDSIVSNGGQWEVIEDKIDQAVSQGKQVFTRDTLTYNTSSFRPDTVTRELIIDGKRSTYEFSNNINLEEIPQSNGSNAEGYTLGELISKPMPQEVIDKISNPKLKEMAIECNNRNANNTEIIKYNGEYDFGPFKVGPEVDAPSIAEYKEILNENPNTQKALEEGKITPSMIREINYDIYRTELGKQLEVSPDKAGKMIGNDAVCIIHEDVSGKMYMVPQWAHENYKHTGYVSHVVNELNGKS